MTTRLCLVTVLSLVAASASSALACSPREFIVYFAAGSAEPSPASAEAFFTVIDEVASYAREARRVEVIGHADGAGAANYNLELSKMRAGQVRSLLIARGVDLTKITMQARGETMPAVAAGEFSEPLNRRVTFAIEWDRLATGALAANCALIPPPSSQ